MSQSTLVPQRLAVGEMLAELERAEAAYRATRDLHTLLQTPPADGMPVVGMLLRFSGKVLTVTDDAVGERVLDPAQLCVLLDGVGAKQVEDIHRLWQQIRDAAGDTLRTNFAEQAEA